MRYGFIAEDAAAVDQHFVTYSASGTLSGIDDRSILSIVVKAIQELANAAGGILDRITGAEARIGALETEIAAIRAWMGSQDASASSLQQDHGSAMSADTEVQ